MMATFIAGLILGSIFTVFIMALCIVSGRASDMEEAMFRKEEKPKVAYLCDQKKETCRGGIPSCKVSRGGEPCQYTSEVEHAKNFDYYGEMYWELTEEEKQCM